MAVPTRPYVVTNRATGVQRLVRAPNQAQARNFVARDQYAVDVASANDAIDLIAAGVKVEDATAEIEAGAQQELPT